MSHPISYASFGCMSDAFAIQKLIEEELRVDDTHNDITTKAVLGSTSEQCIAGVISREAGVFCGESVCGVFQELFRETLSFNCLLADGEGIERDADLVEIQGDGRTCLSIERTLLNFLSHLCGIATLTGKFVEAVKPFGTRILATRKTLPGLRNLELMAIVAGGGGVHRRSLSNGILIKENHLVFVDESSALARAAVNRSPLHPIEIEVQDMETLDKVLKNPPDVIMLDNFGPDDLNIAVDRIAGRSRIEVSGGVTLENVATIARLGVGDISVGRLTHSAPALNLSMDIRRLCN